MDHLTIHPLHYFISCDNRMTCALNLKNSCTLFQETIGLRNHMSQVRLNSLVLQPLIGILYQLEKMEKKEYGASVEGQMTKKN